MQKEIFMVILSLSFQGFSQIKSGVYLTQEIYDFVFIDGEQLGNPKQSSKDTYLHITDNGFRIYTQEGDTGESYSLVFMGVDNTGYNIYAVPLGNRLEFKDDFMVMFHNFDNETGWYGNSTEWHKLKYVRKEPKLEYK